MRRALALLALAALTACSSSDHKGSAAPQASTTPTTGAATSATPSTSAAATAPASSGATAAATTAAPQGSTGSGAPPATTAPGKPSAAKATAPGTYTYDASGTVNGRSTSGTSNLVISALANGMQTSSMHNDQGDTVQSILVRDAGSYLSSLKITSLMGNKEFDFSPAALLFPDPAKVGASWSWGSTSTDGKTTAKATNKILRTETLTIGGEKLATVVLQTHLVLSGDYVYSADVTTWVAPTLRLPVKDHTVGKGSVGAFAFSFDVTDVMRSVHPS